MANAEPMLVVTTVVIFIGEGSFISLTIENICCGQHSVRKIAGGKTYVLVACICENNHWEAGEHWDGASGFDSPDGSSFC